MRKTKEQNSKYQTPKTNNGITLIALIITIIVMLILVAVTITMAVNGGLFDQAGKAATKTNTAILEEKNLAKGQVVVHGTVYDSIDEYINKDKPQEKSFTISSSANDVTFSKIVTEETVKKMNPQYIEYEIVGISTQKDGTFESTGEVVGKSGYLTVVGDISDATFEYVLTDFMNGDEVFYCKFKIDGEEYLQPITVKQGDVITYEEDFLGINAPGVWEVDTNENYSNGKALVAEMDTKEEYNATKIKFNFVGSKVELLFATNETKALELDLKVTDDKDNIIINTPLIVDPNEEGTKEYQISFKPFNMPDANTEYRLELGHVSRYDWDKWGGDINQLPPVISGISNFDAVRIYK